MTALHGKRAVPLRERASQSVTARGRSLDVSVAVQHHPARAQLVAQLLAQIGAADVVHDPEPDRVYGSALGTYLQCLRTTPAGATHRLVVQDDAVACRGFRARAEAAIAEHPDTLVALFVPGRTLLRRLMLDEHKRGGRWVRLPDSLNWTPTVALAWPTHLAHAFVEEGERVIADRARRGLTTHADDPYVGQWRKRLGLPVWATVPCLVQHPDETQSLYRPKLRPRAGANRSRVAALYVDDDGPGLYPDP